MKKNYLLSIVFIFSIQTCFAQIFSKPLDTITEGFGQVFDFQIKGSFGYCMTETGFYRIDISNPVKVSIKSHLSLPSGATFYSKFILTDTIAYISTGTSGVALVDIRNSSSLNLNSTLSNIGNITELAIKGNALYALKSESDQIVVISISNSKKPSIYTTINSSGSYNNRVYAIISIGSYLYCAGQNSRIWRWDISSPSSPSSGTVIDQYFASTYRQILFDTINNYLFLEDNYSDMRTYQLNVSSGSVTQITQSSWYGDNSFPSRISLSGKFFYITSQNGDTYMWDVSTISTPLKIDKIRPTINSYSTCNSVFLNASYCFLSAYGQIQTFALGATTFSGKLLMTSYFNDLKIKDNYLYVALGDGGLKIYDISVPEHPKGVGQLSFSSTLEHIEIDTINKILYCICSKDVSGNKVNIVDISSPSSPSLLSSMSVTWKADITQYCYIRSMKFKNNYAYLFYNYPNGYTASSLNEYGLAVFNVSNKSNPVFVGKFSTVSWNVASLIENDTIYSIERRYFADGPTWRYDGVNCLAKYSIYSPSSPVMIKNLSISDYPINICKNNDSFYVTTGQIYGSSEVSAQSIKYINYKSFKVDNSFNFSEMPININWKNHYLFLSKNNKLLSYSISSCTPIDSIITDFPTGNFIFNKSIVYLCEAPELLVLSVAFLPSIPNLLTPFNKSNNIIFTPKLDWSDAFNTVTYELQISVDSLFTNIIFDSVNINNSELTLKSGILSNFTKYFWRVRAINADGKSKWSSFWSFTTQNLPPDVIKLISPLDKSDCIDLFPVFSWKKDLIASTYRIQISTDTGFTNLVYDMDTFKNCNYFTTKGLSEKTIYFWRVCGKNTAGTGKWSNTFSFKTIKTPVTPSLIYPSKGDTGIILTPILDWKDDTNIINYHLQIAKTTGYKPTIIDTFLNISQFTLPFGKFNCNTVYYWRVMDSNICLNSNWADGYFRTKGKYPSIPIINSIICHNPKYSNPVKFQWNNVPYASGYRFILSDSFDKIDDTNNIKYGSLTIDSSGIVSDTLILKLKDSNYYYWRVKAYNDCGKSSWSELCWFELIITEINSSNADNLFSFSCYPNPFNNLVKIKFSIPEKNHVTVEIYDVFGKEVSSLVNEEKQKGIYEIIFDPTNLKGSVFFYKIKVGDNEGVGKMIHY